MRVKMSEIKKCVLSHCSSESADLFQSPTDSELLAQWKQALGVSENHFFVCHFHFESKWIFYERKLKKLAVPSIYLNSDLKGDVCGCCCEPIAKDDSPKYPISHEHSDAYKMIFDNQSLNGLYVCSKCHQQLTAMIQFKHSVDEKKDVFESVTIKMEPEEEEYNHFSHIEPRDYLESFKDEPTYEGYLEDESVEYSDYEPKRKRRKTYEEPKKEKKKNLITYNCDFCNNFTSTNKKAYAEHVKQNHAINYPAEPKMAGNNLKALESSPVTCDYCGIVVKTKRNLIQHLRSHIQLEDEIKCEKCDRAFKDMRQMVKHKNRYHSEGKFFWCQCNKEFTDKASMQRCRIAHSHLKTKSKVSSDITCDECDIDVIFNNNRQLLFHKNKVHSNGTRFWCLRCGDIFPTKESMINCRKKHYTDSLGNVMVNCPVCGKEMKHNSLKIHMKSTHNRIRDIVCHLCGKNFVATSRLTIHIRQVHSGKKPYHCAHCPHRTALKKAILDHLLKRHMKKRKPYHCTICLKINYDASVHFRHMNTFHKDNFDNGVRVNVATNNYHCPNCNQQFSHMSQYEKHVSENLCGDYVDYKNYVEDGKFTEQATRKFKCKLCDLVQTIPRLKRHMALVHSGEQNCPICDKKMRSKKAVISHLRKVHKTTYRAGMMNAPVVTYSNY